MHVWITSTLVHVLSELLVLPAGFYTSTLSLKDNLCVQSFNSVSKLSLKIKYLLLPLSITKIREASQIDKIFKLNAILLMSVWLAHEVTILEIFPKH